MANRLALLAGVWIEPGDTAETLWRRKLFPIGIRLLEKVLSDVPKFFAEKEPQLSTVATFEPACNPPRVFRPDLLGLPSPDEPHWVDLMGP